MFAQRFTKLTLAGLLAPGLVPIAGCRIEQPPSRLQRHEAHLAQLAQAPLPVLRQPDYDQAALVMQYCGQPSSDVVMPVYSKYYNGPVRRLEYTGRRTVALEFIPSHQRAELAYTEAPLGPGYRGTGFSPNTTWRFQAGRMEQEVMITAHRVEFYLPCAGEALKRDF